MTSNDYTNCEVRTYPIDTDQMMWVINIMPLCPEGQWLGITLSKWVSGEKRNLFGKVLAYHPEISKISMLVRSDACNLF